eukprot:scaffold67827_cov71-Phaeocystis_antarctica.AAC.2
MARFPGPRVVEHGRPVDHVSRGPVHVGVEVAHRARHVLVESPTARVRLVVVVRSQVPLSRHARHIAQLSHVLCNRLHVGRQGVFAIPSVGAILEEAEPVLVPPAHEPGSRRDALRRR